MKLNKLAWLGLLFAASTCFAQNIQFVPAVPYGSGGQWAFSVAVADVNGDGKPDIVVANYCPGVLPYYTCPINIYSTVGLLLGNGDGTFQTAVPYGSGGYEALSVAVADVNGDGKPDVLVSNDCATPQPDCGTFQTAVAYGSGGFSPQSVAVADVNGDSKPDLLVANVYASSGDSNHSTVGVLINITPSQYQAFVQQPINADGSSIFRANRGVVPVKFTLTQNGTPTCALPPATIALTRTAGGTLGSVDENTYVANADSGSNFRIDPTTCQYVYNLAASSLGAGTYRVDISINGIMVGHAVFALK